jgi:CDGSH-type Zn-finger protein
MTISAMHVTRVRAALARVLRRAAGRLSAEPPARQDDGAVITPYPNGPYLVRGAYRMTDLDGNEIHLPRRTIALCRCGLTGSRPWCDGSHKAVRSLAAPGADRSTPQVAAAVGSRGDDRSPVPAAASEEPAAQGNPRAQGALQ